MICMAQCEKYFLFKANPFTTAGRKTDTIFKLFWVFCRHATLLVWIFTIGPLSGRYEHLLLAPCREGMNIYYWPLVGKVCIFTIGPLSGRYEHLLLAPCREGMNIYYWPLVGKVWKLTCKHCRKYESSSIAKNTKERKCELQMILNYLSANFPSMLGESSALSVTNRRQKSSQNGRER